MKFQIEVKQWDRIHFLSFFSKWCVQNSFVMPRKISEVGRYWKSMLNACFL